MAESPVTVYQGGTLAQQVLSNAPEGMLIAPVWRRIAAFAIDVIAMSLLLHVMTRFTFLEILISWSYLTEDVRYASSFLMTWAIFFASLWLYWKYTGRAYGRSLGQRAFRIAIVHDNGTLLSRTLRSSSVSQVAIPHPRVGMVAWNSRCVACTFEGGRVSNLHRREQSYSCCCRLVFTK